MVCTVDFGLTVRRVRVALPLHYRDITVTSPLHYHYITVTSPLHYRYVTVTLPLRYQDGGGDGVPGWKPSVPWGTNRVLGTHPGGGDGQRALMETLRASEGGLTSVSAMGGVAITSVCAKGAAEHVSGR